MLALKVLTVSGGWGGPTESPAMYLCFFPMLVGEGKTGKEIKNPKVFNQTLEIVKMLGFCANCSPKGLCPLMSLKNEKIIWNCKIGLGGRGGLWTFTNNLP